MQQAETPLEMGNRFEVSQSRCGVPPCLEPLLDRAFGVASRRQVMGEQLRLALDEIGEMLFQCRPDARAQFLPSPAQQGRVGSVLHQRVLKQVGGVRNRAAAKQEPSSAELIQCGLQILLGTQRHGLDQFISKLAAEHRADLRDLFGCRPKPVEPRH
jgi:hypothetical protein